MFQCSTGLRRKISSSGRRPSVVRSPSRRASPCSSGFGGPRRPEVESLETLQLLSVTVMGQAPVVNLSSVSASPPTPTSTSPPAAALLQDVAAGNKGSNPHNFVETNGTLFFLA